MSLKEEAGPSNHGPAPAVGARRTLNAILQHMVNLVSQQQPGELFKYIVDKDEVRDYNLYVAEKDEMFLDKIADKAGKGLYTSVQEYRWDIQGVFRNAVSYNTKGRGQHASERMILLAAGVMNKSEDFIKVYQPQLEDAEAQLKMEEQLANSRQQDYQLASSSGPSHWSDADEHRSPDEPHSLTPSSHHPEVLDHREATSGSTRPGSGKLIRIPKSLVETHVAGADFPLSASLDVFMDNQHAARYTVRVYRMTDSSNAGGTEVLYSLKAAPEVHATWKACRQPRWQMEPGPSPAQPLAIRLFLTTNPNAVPVERHVQSRAPHGATGSGAGPSRGGRTASAAGASPSGGSKRKKGATSSKCNVYLPRAVAEEHFGGAVFPKPAELQVYTGETLHSSTRVRLYQHVYTGTNTACQYSVGVTANLHCLWKVNKARIRWVVEHAEREVPTIKMLLPADAAETAAAAASLMPASSTPRAGSPGGSGPRSVGPLSGPGSSGRQSQHMLGGLPPPLLRGGSGIPAGMHGGGLGGGEALGPRRSPSGKGAAAMMTGRVWPGSARLTGSTEESLARRGGSAEHRAMPPPPLMIPTGAVGGGKHVNGHHAYGPQTPLLSPELGAGEGEMLPVRSARKREREAALQAAPPVMVPAVTDSPGGKRHAANKHLYLPKALVAEHFPHVTFPLSIQFDVYIGNQLHSTVPLKVYTYKTGVTDSSFIYSITVRSDVHSMWKEERQHVQWTASPGPRRADPPIVKLMLPASAAGGVNRRSHSEGELVVAPISGGRGITHTRSLPAVATPSPRAFAGGRSQSPMPGPLLHANASALAARGVTIMEGSSHGGSATTQVVRGVKMGAGGRPPAAQPKSRCKKAVYIPRGLAEEWFQGQAFPVSATLEIFVGDQMHTGLDIRVYKCLNQGADVAAKNAAYAIHVRPILHAMWRSARGLVQWEIMARPHQDPLVRMLLPHDTELPVGLLPSHNDDSDHGEDEGRQYGAMQLRRQRLGRTTSLTAAAGSMPVTVRRRGDADAAAAAGGRRGRHAVADAPAGPSRRRRAVDPEDMEAAFLLAGMRDADPHQDSGSTEMYDECEDDYGEDEDDGYEQGVDGSMYTDDGMGYDAGYVDMEAGAYMEAGIPRLAVVAGAAGSLVTATEASAGRGGHLAKGLDNAGMPLYADDGVDAELPEDPAGPLEGRADAAGASRAASWANSWSRLPGEVDPHSLPSLPRDGGAAAVDMEDVKEDLATLLGAGNAWPPLPAAEDLSDIRAATRLLLVAARMLWAITTTQHALVFAAARLPPRQMAVMGTRLHDAWRRRQVEESVSVMNAVLMSAGTEEHQLLAPKGPPLQLGEADADDGSWGHPELPEGEALPQFAKSFTLALKVLEVSSEMRVRTLGSVDRLGATTPSLLAAAHECLKDAWRRHRLDEVRAIVHRVADEL